MPQLLLHYVQLFLSYLKTFLRYFLREFWWLLLVLILGPIFLNLYRSYQKKEEQKKKEITDWVVLEIKINREILQTPKAMEQVFAGLHSFKKGSVSFEIVGFKREVLFCVRLPRAYRKLFESQLYAQYPEVDIKEIYDYFSTLPPFLPNKDYDLFGSEVIFTKANHYPIRTYPLFEEAKEEKRIDPLANLIEAASQLAAGEYLILQILIKPLDSDQEKKWIEEGQKEINKMLGKKEEKKITWQDWVAAFFRNLATGIYTPPVWPGGKKETAPGSVNLSSGDKDKIEQIENKISKLGFETSLRFVYLSPRTIYDEANILTFPAYFKQFNTENLNAFKLNDEATTEVKTKLFPARRTFVKKVNFYQKCKNRQKAETTIILNTEELASIYHFPVVKVKAPALVRTLSRKSEPPPNLPR